MQLANSRVTEKGEIILPKSVRKVLGVGQKGDFVSFLIDNNVVRIVRAKVVPEVTLTDDEIALMANWSRKGTGKIKLKTAKSALKYLWRI